jgi:hypothetical protein
MGVLPPPFAFHAKRREPISMGEGYFGDVNGTGVDLANEEHCVSSYKTVST